MGWSGLQGIDIQDRAFVWADGHIADLGPGRAYSINDNGVVVGVYGIPQHGTACVWVNGVPTLLDSIGGWQSEALAVNNRGEIVGWAYDSLGARRAVLWTSVRGHRVR